MFIDADRSLSSLLIDARTAPSHRPPGVVPKVALVDKTQPIGGTSSTAFPAGPVYPLRGTSDRRGW